jgi:hypothetical protein
MAAFGLSRLVANDDHPQAAAVSAILSDAYSPAVLALLERAGTKVVLLNDGETYTQASAELRRLGIALENWPIPPAGIFVVSERTVYLRSVSRMTVVHEIAHGLDAALGGGVYLSGTDPRFRRAFASAEKFVTPYAASAGDEHFAECVRAWTDRGNDPHSLWPKATRERLASCDPRMLALLDEVFAKIERDDVAVRAGEQLALFAA